MLTLGRISVRALLCALLVLTAWGAQARTVAVGGVNVGKAGVVDRRPLQITYPCKQTRFMIKVYAAALYTQGKVASTEAFHKAAGPKRIHLVMLRDVPGDELGKLFVGDERFGHVCLHSVLPSDRGRGGVRPARASGAVRPYTVRCGPGLTVLRRRPAFR